MAGYASAPSLSVGSYLYSLQKSHVLSQICFIKTSQVCFSKTLHVSASAKYHMSLHHITQPEILPAILSRLLRSQLASTTNSK